MDNKLCSNFSNKNNNKLKVFLMFPFQELLLSYLGKKKYIIIGLLICVITNIFLGLIDKIDD